MAVFQCFCFDDFERGLSLSGKRHVRFLDTNRITRMSIFKKTPVQSFTKASVVTNEDCEYWKQLGVSEIVTET